MLMERIEVFKNGEKIVDIPLAFEEESTEKTSVRIFEVGDSGRVKEWQAVEKKS